MDTKTQEQDGNQDENLARGVAMRRLGSDQGKAMSIPTLGSRQSSQTDIAKLKSTHPDHLVTEPLWNHEAILYVVDSVPRALFANKTLVVMLLVNNPSLTSPYMTKRTRKPLLAMFVSVPELKTTRLLTNLGSS